MNDELLRSHDRPIPASYRLAATVASLVALMSFATVRWAPWFVADSGWLGPVGPDGYVMGPESRWIALGVGFTLPVVAAVWLAFRWPIFAVVLAALPAALTWMDGNGLSMHFGTFAGLGGVALVMTWRRPGVAAATTALATVIAWLWLLSGKDMIAPFGAVISLRYTQAWSIGLAYTVVFLLIFGLGLLMRRSAFREEHRLSLVANAEAVANHAAVVAERSRLARDLHDVVAHHISLIAVRAETAPYTDPGLDDAGRAVLADIAADARLALDELRGVLGILGRAGDAGRAPQPTLADIGALVERTRVAGQEVHLECDLTTPVSASAGYVAYRVVQEALTNARKHAPGVAITVVVEATSRVLAVQVSNPSKEATHNESEGRGLVGMRERVEGIGGRLRLRNVAGRFELEATLPTGGLDAG